MAIVTNNMNYAKIALEDGWTVLQCKIQSQVQWRTKRIFPVIMITRNRPVFNTPCKVEDMKPRIVDDYKPQTNMRSLLAKGKRTAICHVKKLSYFSMRALQNSIRLFQKTKCAAAIAYLPK